MIPGLKAADAIGQLLTTILNGIGSLMKINRLENEKNTIDNIRDNPYKYRLNRLRKRKNGKA